MAKMTKTQVLAALADAAGITKKQAAAVVEQLVALAYKGAKDGFTIPGQIGRASCRERV